MRCHDEEVSRSVRPAADKVSYMVGSYGPRVDEQEFLSPVQEAPSGLMSRGQYEVQSRLVDDDKNVYLTWDWTVDIKKDWDD